MFAAVDNGMESDNELKLYRNKFGSAIGILWWHHCEGCQRQIKRIQFVLPFPNLSLSRIGAYLGLPLYFSESINERPAHRFTVIYSS